MLVLLLLQARQQGIIQEGTAREVELLQASGGCEQRSNSAAAELPAASEGQTPAVRCGGC